MKPLIVYYSLEGHTALIAGELAKQTGADLLALKPEKEIRTDGWKFFLGGKSVLFNEKPPLANDRIDLDNYDPIFLGSPIWASSYAPPVATFLADYAIRGKRLAFFFCGSSGRTKKALEKLEKILGSENAILGKIDFIDPKAGEKPEIEDRLSKWLSEILPAQNQPSA